MKYKTILVILFLSFVYSTKSVMGIEGESCSVYKQEWVWNATGTEVIGLKETNGILSASQNSYICTYLYQGPNNVNKVVPIAKKCINEDGELKWSAIDIHRTNNEKNVLYSECVLINGGEDFEFRDIVPKSCKAQYMGEEVSNINVNDKVCIDNTNYSVCVADGTLRPLDSCKTGRQCKTIFSNSHYNYICTTGKCSIDGYINMNGLLLQGNLGKDKGVCIMETLNQSKQIYAANCKDDNLDIEYCGIQKQDSSLCGINSDGSVSCNGPGQINTCNSVDGKILTQDQHRNKPSSICYENIVYSCSGDLPNFTKGDDCNDETHKDSGLTKCCRDKANEIGCRKPTDCAEDQENVNISITTTTSDAFFCDAEGGESDKDGIDTAIGCIPFTVNGLVEKLLPNIFGIGGGDCFFDDGLWICDDINF